MALAWLERRLKGFSACCWKFGRRREISGILIHESERPQKTGKNLSVRFNQRQHVPGASERTSLKQRCSSPFAVFCLSRVAILCCVYELFALPLRLAVSTGGDIETAAVSILADMVLIGEVVVLYRIRNHRQFLVQAGIFQIPNVSSLALSFLACVSMYIAMLIHAFEQCPALGYCINGSYIFWILVQLLRLQRIRRLYLYFRGQEMDLHTNVQKTAVLKFILTIWGSAHWIGCLWFFLARLRQFDSTTWVGQYMALGGTSNSILVTPTSKFSLSHYLLVIYWGFNSLTKLGSEDIVPGNALEMVFSILVAFCVISVFAYIIATLFHFLVKKDDALEQYRLMMVALDKYSEARSLPTELRHRLRRYFDFQYQKRADDYREEIFSQLPQALQIKVSCVNYSAVIHNVSIFKASNPQFLQHLMAELTEVYLMPGELLINRFDMSRELSFVLRGRMEVLRANELVRVVHPESEHGSIIGEVAFFIGIPQPYTLQASLDGDVTLLVYRKDRYTNLIQSFPEQHEHLVSNLLATFGLSREGKDIAYSNGAEEEDDVFMSVRESIRQALEFKGEVELAQMTFAATEGDLEEVRALLLRGLDVNKGDYDQRTTLHLAAAEGNSKVVACLLAEGAEVDVQDRWGRTPMQDAIAGKHDMVVDLLSKYGAKLTFSDAASHLCRAAVASDIPLLRTYTSRGVDPNIGDYDSRTALHLAASEGNLEVVKLLVDVDADTMILDRWNRSPLDDAVSHNHQLVARLLRDNGSSLNTRFVVNNLCRAVARGEFNLVRLMIESGVDVKQPDFDGRTALHIAAARGQVVVAEYLIYSKAVVNAQDRWGHTPLHDALRAESWQGAKLLLSSGGKVFGEQAQQQRIKLASLKRRDMVEVLTFIAESPSRVSRQRETALGRELQRLSTMATEEMNKLDGSLASVRHRLTQDGSLAKVLFPMASVVEEEGAGDGEEEPRQSVEAGRRRRAGGLDLSDALNIAEAAGGSQHIISPKHRRHHRKPHSGTVSKNTTNNQPRTSSHHHNSTTTAANSSSVSSADDSLKLSANLGGNMTIRDSIHRSVIKAVRAMRPLMLRTASYLDEVFSGRVVGVALERPNVLRAESLQEALVSVGLDVQLSQAHVVLSDAVVVAAPHISAMEKRLEEEARRGNLRIQPIAIPAAQTLLTIPSFQNLFLKSVCRHSTSVDSGCAYGYCLVRRTIKRSMSVWNVLNKAHTNQTNVMLAELSSHIHGIFTKHQQERGPGDVSALLPVTLLATHKAVRSKEMTLVGDLLAASYQERFIAELVCLSFHDLKLENDNAEAQESAAACERVETNVVAPQSSSGSSKVFSLDPSVLDVDGRKTLNARQAENDALRRVFNIVDSMQRGWVTIGELVDALRTITAAEPDDPASGELIFSAFSSYDTELKVYWPQFRRCCRDHDKLRKILQDGETALQPESRSSKKKGGNRSHLVDSELIAPLIVGGPVMSLLFSEASLSQLSVLRSSMQREHSDTIKTVSLLRAWTLRPASRLWYYWKILALMGSLYYAFAIPFEIAFGSGTASGNVVGRCVDVFFFLDLAFKFLSPFLNEASVLVTRTHTISTHYLSHGFQFDLCAAIPLDLVILTAGHQSSYFVPLVRSNRLLRLRVLYRHYRVDKEDHTNDPVRAQLRQMLAMGIALTHFSACMWYTIAALQGLDATAAPAPHSSIGEGPSWFARYFGFGSQVTSTNIERYLLSAYWVFSTLSYGHGDIEPRNTPELLFTLFVCLQNLTFYAYALSEISSLFMLADEKLVEKRAEILKVEAYIKSKQLPYAVQNEIRRDFEIRAQQGGSQQFDIYGQLSHSLRVEIARHTSRSLLGQVDVLSDCEAYFLDSLSVALTEHTVPLNSYLYHEAEVAKKFYIVSSGSFELTVSALQEAGPEEVGGVDRVVSVGATPGHLAFFFNIRHTDSARTPPHSGAVVLALERAHYLNLTSLFPDAEGNITRNSMKEWDAGNMGLRAGFRSTRSLLRQTSSLLSGNSVSRSDSMAQAMMRKVTATILQAKNRKQNERSAAMCSAAAKGNLEQVKSFVESSTLEDLNRGDYDGRTPLHLAAAEGHLPVVEYLVANRANVNVEDRFEGTPIKDAIRHQHDAVTAYLRAHGAQVTYTDEAALLCGAASEGNTAQLKRLVDSGINPNKVDYDLRAALHLAASNGHLETCQYLLHDVGVEVNPVDRWGGTPLQDAVRHGHTQVATEIRDKRGRLLDSNLAYKLCVAASENDFETIRTYVTNGADINSATDDGRTALHVAVSHGHCVAAAQLLRLPHIQVNPIDFNYGTPLDDARRHNHEAVALLLEQHGGMAKGDPRLLDLYRARDEVEENQRTHAAEQSVASQPGMVKLKAMQAEIVQLTGAALNQVPRLVSVQEILSAESSTLMRVRWRKLEDRILDPIETLDKELKRYVQSIQTHCRDLTDKSLLTTATATFMAFLSKVETVEHFVLQLRSHIEEQAVAGPIKRIPRPVPALQFGSRWSTTKRRTQSIAGGLAIESPTNSHAGEQKWQSPSTFKAHRGAFEPQLVSPPHSFHRRHSIVSPTAPKTPP